MDGTDGEERRAEFLIVKTENEIAHKCISSSFSLSGSFSGDKTNGLLVRYISLSLTRARTRAYTN